MNYYRQLPYTLKIGADDERFIILYIIYFADIGNPKLIKESACDTFVAYSKKNIRLPMNLKFFVRNDSLEGLNYLRGIIVDQTFLQSYSASLSVRMLEEVCYFNKSVHIQN